MPIFEIQFTSKIDSKTDHGRKPGSSEDTFLLVDADNEAKALSFVMTNVAIMEAIPGSIANVQVRHCTKYKWVITNP